MTAAIGAESGVSLHRFPNGTTCELGHDSARTVLPNGAVVEACPNDDSPAMAERLGYGSDVAAMTRHRDLLHCALTSWLGLPYSYSLMAAAGCEVDGTLAALEEAAVLATQRLMHAAGVEVF